MSSTGTARANRSTTDGPAPRPEEGAGLTDDTVGADEAGAGGHAADDSPGLGADDRREGYVPV